MKKHLTKRLLSLALALIMILGILPTNLGLSTEAATPAEEATAASLLSQIEAIETGTRYSKYVRVTGFHTTDANQYPTAKTTLQNLSGYYIAVTQNPITVGGDIHYALNMAKSPAFCKYQIDKVQVIGDQLFGADPQGALHITYDTSGSSVSGQASFAGSAQYSSARAKYFLADREGNNLNIDATNERISKQKAQSSLTIYASYPLGAVRFLLSGTYKSDYTYYGLTLYTAGKSPYAYYSQEATGYFYLFEEKTNRVNVEPLYNALVEAKTYLINPNPYETTSFATFLTAVEYGIQTYDNYNKDSTSAVSTGENLVAHSTQLLEETMTKVKPYDEQINELMIPATQQIASLSEIEEGSYYILAMDRNGFYRSFDPASNGTLTSTCKAFNTLIPIYFNGSQIERTDLVGSATLYAIPSSGYSIQLSDGQYLRLTDNTTATTKQEDVDSGKPMAMKFIERKTAGDTNEFTQASKAFLIQCAEDPQIYLCTSNNGNRFHAWRYESPAESEANDEYDKYLFRISDLTLELFKALEYVEPYAGGNADGRYDETVYSEFIVVLKDALKKYRENRSTMSDSVLQPDLDRLAAELKDYARKLTLADSQASYIDIPVEILDFASDKLLFEGYSGSDGARFSMSGWATIRESAKNDTLLQPLVTEFISNVESVAGTTTNKAMLGLVGDRLVKDKPVYEDYVIGFIAAAILTEWMADSSDSHRTQWADQVTAYEESLADTQWQDAFWNILSSLYSDYKNGNAAQKKAVLGSLQATLNDTDTKANGGELLWSKVNTAYDLAYYMLNNIWQPATEALPDGRAYNTVVTERDTLRLYYDESTGLYTIDASNRMVYDGYMIYNTVPQINQNRNRFPLMTPIDGLGFEKGGAETDPGTYRADYEGWEPDYAKTNMNYTLHASGSFIYYEDQEQKFEFVGDDDVYFFVNNKRVMDIGGTHGPAGFTLDLRAANADPELALGLEDGGVYSFDMFYAERHTDGSNMKFSTNIKIVSAETMTSKGQYAVEVAGSSTVGSNGKGGEMIDNQLVNVGDVVAYSFDITNHRDCPVTDLEFHDESLGVYLNSDNILTYPTALSTGKEVASLTNPTLCNGVVTQFKDLIIEYTTVNSDGTLATGPVTEISPTDMINLIRSKVKLTGIAYTYAPLEAGIYRVPVATAQQLRALLKEGIPMECRISIYGFMRKTVSTDAPYANELTTYCSYRRSANKDAEFATITGKAGRILRVPAATEMPDIPRIEITLDYGKPVQIPLADITNQIFFEKDSPASVVEIVGYVEEGYNGQLLKKLPKDLLELAVGDTVQGLQGTFTLRETSMEYAMWEFMEKVETLYAVVKLNNFNHAASGTQYEYALVELRLIPTNMMYYEAEDFTGSEISYMKKDGDVDYLFFDFDGTGTDLQKNSAVYGNTDWETVEYDANGNALLSYWRTKASGGNKPVLKREESSVYLDNMSTSNGLFISNATGAPKTALPSQSGYILEVRMKSRNLSSSYESKATAYYEGGSSTRSDFAYQQADGEWHVYAWKFTISEPIIRLGVLMKTSTTLKEVYVDYLYYGPAEKAPSKLKAAGKDITQVLSCGSADNWELKTDNVDTADDQDFNPVNHRTYDMVIDRDNIPAEAFFVDFDGTGYENRYRLQPQYKGNDFDSKSAWYSHNGRNSIYNTHAPDAKAGTMVLSNLKSKDENGNPLGAWIQTVVSGGDIGSTGVQLVPGTGHFAQIRFRVENCTAYAGAGNVSVFFSNNEDTETEGNVAIDDHRGKVAVSNDEVLTGDYITVKIPLEISYYTESEIIDIMRVYIAGYTDDGSGLGKITIDYIYVGPEKGMDQDVYDEYLYFTFDNTLADQLRYTGSIYGSTSTTKRNYDTLSYWSSSTAGGPVSKGGTLNITNGCLVFADKDDGHYNYVHAGKENVAKETPFSYRLTGSDVYRIRFKITETPGQTLAVDPGSNGTGVPIAILEVGDSGLPGAYCHIDLEEYADGEFHTLTMSINAPNMTSNGNNITMLNWIRPTFSYISGATFTIDYIYVGPASMVDKVTQKADYLFFDFTNNDAAKSRYSNPAYGTYGKNFDTEGWHVNHSYSTPCLPTFSASTGTMSFKTVAQFYTDSKSTIALATASECHFSRNHPLDFDLTGNEYFKVRMKIEGSTDTSANFIVRYSDVPTSDADNTNAASSFDYTIPAEAIKNGEWFTLEGSIKFGSATKITSLRFDVYNITMSASNKPITVTYDYIYVGPAEKASVTTESLFFGFDNEEEDRARYGSYVYGGWNYDDAYTYGTKGIGHWVTSSEMNGFYHDYAINNEKGTLNVGVGAGHTGKEEDDWIYGPYIMTTDCYGYYSMSADRATLKYRPEHADVVQVRFRVSNCEQGPGREPNVVFLFGGYDTAGNYVDYNNLVVMRKFYTLQEGYITVSIPTNQAFRELAMVTNLGLRFQNVVNYDGEGLIEIDYIYVGPGEGAPYTYGYDSSYDTNSLYSDGNSLFTEGNGVRIDANPNPAKYTETRFSFKGTGFDLISRTGADQGLIRVEIYTDPSYHKDYRLEGASVNLKGELELYQIPVYSKHNLTYGTYYVSVMVNAGVNYPAIPALSRGDDFYLDAIRIYDPIDVSQGSGAAAGSDSAIAYAAYCADIEAHPVVKEVRDILLTAEEYTGGGLIQDGAVFVDYSTVEKVISPTTSEGTGGEDVTDPDLVGKVEKHITSDIVTYKKIGPNNETYLGPQQLVAFKILVFANKVPNRLDIGAKTIVGGTAKMDIKAWGWRKIDDKTNERQIEQALDTVILGPSHQYYSLYLESDIWETVKVDGKWCRMATVIISNPAEKESVAGENVLSITDVRVGHRQTADVWAPGIDGVEPEPTTEAEITAPTETSPGSGGGASAGDAGVKSVPTRSTEVELPEDEWIRFVVTGDLLEEVELALKDAHGICEGEHIPGTWQTLCLPDVGQDGIEQLRCTRCGEVLEEKRTPGIAAMTFAGASVSLQSDLAIHYKVNESYFTEQGYTDPYVVVTDNGIETVIRDYTVSDGRLSFVYKNIAPHRIGDTVTATLYAYYNGTLYSSESRDYSIADYCYNILNKYGTNEKYATLRTLLVDILHYGAKTQEFAGYRTDSLCNARLTEAQLSWGTELTREPVNLRNLEHEVIENPTVQWKGAGLNLKESVAVRFCMVAESYEDLEVRITLNGITESYTAEDFEYRADGTYIHFTKLNAAQMSEPILVAAYRNGEQVSNTMCYSIESYAYAKQNDTTYPYLGELAERMICYGDSARAYIGK